MVASCCEQFCKGSGLSLDCERIIDSQGRAVNGACVTDDNLDCDGDRVPNANDCAMCNAALDVSVTRLYVDADRDGYASGWVEGCVGSAQLASYVESVVSPDALDCDDAASDRWQWACRDTDGDGWCVSPKECVGALPPGYRPGDIGYRRTDCDDSNASLQQTVYGDEDGDGFLADFDHPTSCQPYSVQRPLGVSNNPGTDCDDHSSGVFPEQADLVGDGIDANCDGSDGWRGATCVDGCECWPTAICSTVEPTCTTQADLAIVDALAGAAECSRATSALVAIVNRGGAAFDGEVTVTESDFYGGDARDAYCWYDTKVALKLGPSESRIIEVDPLCRHVQLVVGAGADCALDNNQFQLRPEQLACR
jgi:hypothetical protein